MTHRTVGLEGSCELGASITADDFPLLQLAVEYTVMKEVAIRKWVHCRSRRMEIPSGFLFVACACKEVTFFFWVDPLWSTEYRLISGTFTVMPIQR